MDKQYISKLQEKVISLLRSYEKGTTKPLNLLVEDACSEVSRLLACWILADSPTLKTLIAKGENVQNKNEFCHDVLLAGDDGKVTIIDPTIWQIFPEKTSIFVGEVDSVENALALLTEQYQGVWKVSETIMLAEYPEKEQKELENVIEGIVTYEE